ncbi:RICIN domain-containing protein [Lacinutrix jangbogonensis]|uniref:RICIN domain-containing protein n=1 Tax=Lacinutrix jangbogonensis TaxID=1469557 RepID=UPI00068CC761|nr:RICIN domain-containing protein [Lacinutrix jangbogonensis]
MCHSVIKISPIILILCFISNLSFAQNTFVYNGGTNWQDSFYSIINATDASTFKTVTFETEKTAKMWDRDANNNQGAWSTPMSWVYTLTYNDGITSKIRVRQSDFTKNEAGVLANKYGNKMGQLPACLRKGVSLINIMKSDALFGGNNYNHSIDITIGETSKLYEKTGNMEETLFHESTHAALDNLYQTDWKANRDKDATFISKYAAENPNREDISESFILYAALNYRPDRIASETKKIESNISNRIEYYKNLELDMFPFTTNNKNIESLDLFDSNAYYKLTCQWQGDDKALDIVNDGKNNQPQLAKTANVTGQMWRIEKTEENSYTLSTNWQGPKKLLDCIPGTNENLPMLNQETADLGSSWHITPAGNGFYRITNRRLNECSLDIINDGENNKLQLAETANVSGQLWKITKIK